MTDTLTATGTRADVEARLERLLADHPPASTDPKAFWGAQYDLGLAWVHFPVGHGGLGANPDLQEVVDARLAAVGAPANLLHNFVGLGMAAPVIVAFGTEEQKRRFLRPLFTCEELWCQMFSEPSAGSDLASLATTAGRDGDEWVVNGHKVWTTMAHIARWGILIARTDTEAPKHRGLTYFICDMNAPGVEIRPLRQITGEAEFNEVIMTDVSLPDSLRLGEVGDGWRVTLATLMNERMHNAETAKRPRGSGPIRHAMRLWRERFGDQPDPVRRDKLMKLWIEAEIIRLTSLRAGQLREQGTPGPEGSILKLPIGEFPQRLFDFCLELKGPYGTLIEHYDLVQPTIMSHDTLGDDQDPDMAKAFLNTRSHTIGGGTSEMQRNTIGERVLGLPPEPKVDKNTPWSQLRRN